MTRSVSADFTFRRSRVQCGSYGSISQQDRDDVIYGYGDDEVFKVNETSKFLLFYFKVNETSKFLLFYFKVNETSKFLLFYFKVSETSIFFLFYFKVNETSNFLLF